MPRFDVTVVGELNLDLILYGYPEELSTERELLAEGMALTLGSSSAIFAHNLAVLGSRVGFVSRVGDDPLGQMSIEQLASGGVDVAGVRKVVGPTMTGLTVILPHESCRHILTYPGTMWEMCYEDLDLQYLASARHFHLSSFFLHRALRPRVAELLRRMKAEGLTTSLDTNDDPDDCWNGDLFEALAYVDIFFPNEREAKKITRREDLEAATAKLCERTPLVVVKRGAEGALARRDKEVVSSPAIPVAVVDPVGAGDSFNAGFLHAHLQGADLATCLLEGNRAAALSTTRPGGTEAFRDRQYLNAFYAQFRPEKGQP